MTKRVLIIGANSDIAQSAGKMYLEKGCEVLFAGHKPEELPDWAQPRLEVDLVNAEGAFALLTTDSFDIVVYSAGKLASNEECRNPVIATAVRNVNFDTPSLILPVVAAKMKERGSGVLVGISSVAADRAKASHYLYGASKAGFDYLLTGLRLELKGSGVRVLTIRPGYVDTKMIAGMKTPWILTASKEQVAKRLVENSFRGNRNVIYVKGIWRPMMWVIRHIPRFIFNRMKL